MRICNKTRKTTISDSVTIADTVWGQMKGLMFRKSLGAKESLMMSFSCEKTAGIWMLFMRFPIDMIFLDKKMKVVDICERMKPVSFNPSTWKVFYPEKPSKYIIETVSGVVKKTRTAVGDYLEACK